VTYKIEAKVDDDGYEYRTTLFITDNEDVREYSDGGEPEDNSFGRDWNWVPKELERAYAAGLRDGKKASEEPKP
jgi:hypothetical protein